MIKYAVGLVLFSIYFNPFYKKHLWDFWIFKEMAKNVTSFCPMSIEMRFTSFLFRWFAIATVVVRSPHPILSRIKNWRSPTVMLRLDWKFIVIKLLHLQFYALKTFAGKSWGLIISNANKFNHTNHFVYKLFYKKEFQSW